MSLTSDVHNLALRHCCNVSQVKKMCCVTRFRWSQAVSAFLVSTHYQDLFNRESQEKNTIVPLGIEYLPEKGVIWRLQTYKSFLLSYIYVNPTYFCTRSTQSSHSMMRIPALMTRTNVQAGPDLYIKPSGVEHKYIF